MHSARRMSDASGHGDGRGGMKHDKLRRLRTPWNDYEIQNLLIGVYNFGIGKWAMIRMNMSFKANRTYIDLKDKWRNLVDHRKYAKTPLVYRNIVSAIIKKQQAHGYKRPEQILGKNDWDKLISIIGRDNPIEEVVTIQIQKIPEAPQYVPQEVPQPIKRTIVFPPIPFNPNISFVNAPIFPIRNTPAPYIPIKKTEPVDEVPLYPAPTQQPTIQIPPQNFGYRTFYSNQYFI